MNINKKLFAGIFYTFFVNGFLALTLGTILPYLKSENSINYVMAGYLLSTHSIGNLLASFTFSVSAFYFGRKRTIVFFSFFLLISFYGVTATGSLLLLFPLFFLTGLARGSISNANNAFINDAATGKSFYLNLLHVFFAIGAFIAPLLASYLIGSGLPWRTPVYVGLVLAAAAVIVYITLPIDNASEKTKKASAEIPEHPFYKTPEFYLAGGVLFFYLGTETTVNGWIVTYLADSGRMNAQVAQVILSLIWATIIFGRLAAAFLSNRVRKTSLILISCLGAALMFCVFAISRNNTVTAIAIILFAFFFAGTYPTTVAATGRILKGNSAAMGALLAVAGAGGILMPTITGMVAEKINIHAGMVPAAVSVVLTVIFAILFRLKIKE